MANAIDYNLDLAIREISWNLDQFLVYQDTPLTSLGARQIFHTKIESIRKHYREGRWPLLLYYSHVVAVHSVVKYADKIVFGIYDSNYSTSIEYVITYGNDGLPKAGQKMIWDTTPDRLTTICW